MPYGIGMGNPALHVRRCTVNYVLVSLCPGCQEVDISFDEQMRSADETTYVEELCYECQGWEGGDVIINDHCQHVLQHPDCFFDRDSVPSVIPF